MCGICAMGFLPWLELRSRTRVDDARRTVLQGLRDLVNNWADKWRQQAKDKGSQCFGNVVDELLETGDLGDPAANGFDNLISELENWVDLASCLDRVKVGAHPWHDILVLASVLRLPSCLSWDRALGLSIDSVLLLLSL